MNPNAVAKAVSGLVMIVCLLWNHYIPFALIPEDVQLAIVSVISFILTDFIVSRYINPAGIVSRSKAPEQLDKIISER